LDNGKNLDRVWRDLKGSLEHLFRAVEWTPFALEDDYATFQTKALRVREAVALSIGCKLSRSYALLVEGASEKELEILSSQVARSVVQSGLRPGSDLQRLVQAEEEARDEALSCKELFRVVLGRAEGDQPLWTVYAELGADLASLELTPKICAKVWGPHVRERGIELAMSLAKAMTTHQRECRRAYVEHYAPEERRVPMQSRYRSR
jgi:hypothetical protein